MVLTHALFLFKLLDGIGQFFAGVWEEISSDHCANTNRAHQQANSLEKLPHCDST